jgi:hypothetical protein
VIPKSASTKKSPRATCGTSGASGALYPASSTLRQLEVPACIDKSFFDRSHEFIKGNVAEPTVDTEHENDGVSLD